LKAAKDFFAEWDDDVFLRTLRKKLQKIFASSEIIRNFADPIIINS
jgi:hypothetical protein